MEQKSREGRWTINRGQRSTKSTKQHEKSKWNAVHLVMIPVFRTARERKLSGLVNMEIQAHSKIDLGDSNRLSGFEESGSKFFNF